MKLLVLTLVQPLYGQIILAIFPLNSPFRLFTKCFLANTLQTKHTQCDNDWLQKKNLNSKKKNTE